MTVTHKLFPSAERLYRLCKLGVYCGGETKEGGEREKDNALPEAWLMSLSFVGPSCIALRGNPVDCGLFCK